ncbi:MAG TPA: alpha/beta fold hydrolase [Candidatus Limnocylindrales bacterium]|nr:alpha/beta fold hydrolase [Candidatus Limnocylindrales bacterium]
MTTDRPDATPIWIARFRAPLLTFPSAARDAPDRLVLATTESGSYQLWTWDRSTGERRRVSDEPIGVTGGAPTADGGRVVWFRDTTGDESGRFVAAPFEGGEATPFLEGVPDGWDEGLAIGRRRTVAAISDPDGFAVYVAEESGPARRIYRHPESVRLAGGSGLAAGSVQRAGLSADETLVAIEHAEGGDLIHPALRVLDARTGETVADLRDPGRELVGFGWSPVPGDTRLAIGHERRGERAAAIWDVRSGDVHDIAPGLDGVVEVADWWPDGSALLLVQTVAGRTRLHRYDLSTGRPTELPTPPGSVTGAAVRPNGEVWYLHQSGIRPGRLFAVGRPEPLFEPPGPPAPPGRPFLDWAFTNPAGDRVHGFRVVPEGSPPYPTLMLVHGGPTWLDLDRWAPEVQALVDAGFQVAMVNYRGSIGFGSAWRDAVIGNIGWPESEDILAGFDDLVARGLADPDRSAIAGWSWGGYLTLLIHGMHPERFVAGVAGVPVGDYAAGYEDLSPTLQAYDRALLGGTPADVPELMRERSPISYVDRVRAPLLILAGEHDSRCPIRQVMLYVERLRARNHPHELYLFDAGHSSLRIEERIRQRAVVLDFLARHVPGIRRLPGVAELVAEVVPT